MALDFIGATDNIKDKYLGVKADLKQKSIDNKINVNNLVSY